MSSFSVLGNNKKEKGKTFNLTKIKYLHCFHSLAIKEFTGFFLIEDKVLLKTDLK
jgi:hypothetical protein